MAFQRLLWAVVVGVPGIALAQTQTDLFDPTVVHEIRIGMPAGNWQSLKDHYLDNTYYNVDSYQWKGAGSNTLTVNSLQVRSRGHGSRSPIKPSLHVDFTKLVSTQRFLGFSEIELKANTQDPSMIHELLSFELMARMGVITSRAAPTRLYVNGEYIGLYNMVESPADPVYLQRNFNETGGYVYEYKPGDWLTPAAVGSGYHFEYLGPNLDLYSSGTANTPFDPKNHSNAPDTVTLEAWIRTMNQASDADFLSAISTFTDSKQFLNQVAVETYLADFDCILGDIFGLNNFYIYRYAKSQFTAFMAWDKDNAFDWTQRPVLQNANQNVLMRRLIAIPDLKKYYFEQFAKTTMLAGGSGGWLQSEANRLNNLIQQAAHDDTNKTYLDGGVLYPSSNARFDAAVATVIAFPGDRTAFVVKDLAAQGYQTPSNYPTLSDGGVLNAAAFAAPAAGGLATIYGANLGDAKSTAVYINGFATPLVFASSGQLNVQVPWEATGFASFGTIVNGAPSNIQFSSVITYSPGVFNGPPLPPPAAVTHVNGSLVTDSNPAAANEVLVVYTTGLGPVNGPMVTGQPASTTSLQPTTQQATATMNSAPAAVSFSGLTPGFIGLYQVNVQVPSNISGTGFLTISIGGSSAPAVAVPVK